MLIDSHCHLVDERYEKDVGEIIKEAKEWEVEGFINIGTSLEETRTAISVAKKYPEVHATAGIYPHKEMGGKIEVLEKSLEFLLSENVVAIGECGIDISDNKKGRVLEDQMQLFEMQVKLSIKHNLPLSIHNRNGDSQILNILKKYPGARGVMHCFTSNWDFAKELLNMGFYISFSAIITYPSARNLTETVEKVPLDKFLVETDAPYLPPQNQRGQVNFPKNVKIVASKIAEIKKIPFEDICKHSYENTIRVFDL